MVIDIHAYPGFFREISEDPKRVEYRRERFYLYKQHVWPLELSIKQMDAAGIDQSVLLPEDLTTLYGATVVSNEEVAKLVELAPTRYIGFASVDPHRKDALVVLDRAFGDLKLCGLNLNPSTQRFFPTDDALRPIYEKCLEYDKPIMFHAGIAWEPNAPAKYSKPLNFEDVAIDYPALRMCLAHFGWPWVQDVAALLLKYPNLYADTALLYFDSPKEFFDQTFNTHMGPHWIDRSLIKQVMFGSNYPRIEQARMKEAVESLQLRPSTLSRVLGGNALRFLGMKEQGQ